MRTRYYLLSIVSAVALLATLPARAQVRGERSTVAVRPATIDPSKFPRERRHLESEIGERDADVMLADDTSPEEWARIWARVKALRPGEAGGTPLRDMTDSRKRDRRQILAAPTLGRNFGGSSTGGPYPPDPSMAVSANHIVQVVNSTIRVLNKNGTTLMNQGLATFFTSVTPPSFIYDPKVFYDPDAQRFVVLEMTFDTPTQTAFFLVAASKTADPTGQWWFYKLDSKLDGATPTNNWTDYPGLGFDDQAIYLTGNQYTFAGNAFAYSKIRILDKSVVYAGGAVTWFDFVNMKNADNSTVFTVKPVQTYGAAGGEYLVNTKPGGANFVTLWKITNPLAATPTLTRQGATGRTNVGSYLPPPTSAQQGGCTSLDAGDNRTQDAIWSGGTLYTAFTESHNWGSGSVGSLRILKINTTTATATQDFTFGSNSTHYIYPNATVDPCGRMFIGFSKTSSTQFPEFRMVVDPWNDPTTLLVKSGTLCYNASTTRNRWGDYSGIGVDPAGTVWASAEYANGATSWSTWIGEIVGPSSTLIVTPSRDTAVCAGNAATVGVAVSGGTPPYNVTWTPTAGLASPGQPVSTATPTTTTAYHADVTDACGTIVGANVTVTVNQLPNPVITGDPVVCANVVKTYSTNFGNGRSYDWLINGGTIVGTSNINRINIAWGSSGTGSIQLTETILATGCAVTTPSYPIVINPNPVAAAGNDIEICAGSSAPLGGPNPATQGLAPYIYLWSPAAGLNSALDPHPVASPVITTTYHLLVTDARGCTSTDTIIVTVNQLPEPVVTANHALVMCEGDSLLLSANDGFTSYHWSNGDTTRQITVRKGGAYAVAVTNSKGCPKASDSTYVTVNPRPVPTVQGPPSVCPQSSTSYSAGNVPTENVQWSVTGGTITSGQGTKTVFVKWGAIGTGRVDLVATRITTGCSSLPTSLPITIQNNLAKPAVATDGNVSLCQGDKLTLSAPEGYALYDWSTGDHTRQITVDKAGPYTVSVTDSGGCTSSKSDPVNVTVHPLPAKPTIGNVPDTDSLFAINMMGTFTWRLGNVLLPQATGGRILVRSDGSYTVTFTDTNGCSATSDPFPVNWHPASVDGEAGGLSMAVRPNPNNGLFTVEATIAAPTTVRLTLTDLNGKLIRALDEGRVGGAYRKEIDVRDIPSGVYIVEITIGARKVSRKIVKE
ncbi:MAG: T9SS type A sorting domain-containing protein [Candidatus Kapaibacterium sp.]